MMRKNKMIRKITALFFAAAALSTAHAVGENGDQDHELVLRLEKDQGEIRVDNPVDAWLTAHSGPAGKAVDGGYKRRFDLLDASDFKKGSFSIVLTPTKAHKGPSAFGFHTGPYFKKWELSETCQIHFQAKYKGKVEDGGFELALYDMDGNRAFTALNGLNTADHWQTFDIPLKTLNKSEQFNCKAIQSIQLEANLTPTGKVWIDDLLVSDADKTLGISDKTITRYMAETARTRPIRNDATLRSMKGADSRFIGALYRGENLEQVNQDLIEAMKDKRKDANADWGLWTGSEFNWTLFGFSSFGRIKANRLSPEAEALWLEGYWEHCKFKNDIATARRSVWNVTGSENHDINFKHENLLSSQIFMNLPEYKDRIYPNLGRMAGYGYGRGSAFSLGGDDMPMALGSGNYKDGKDYRPADHYKAWVTFWKEYIRERAKRGFFNEHNANGYVLHTGRFLHDIYAWSDDPELKEQARMVLDLAWAQWAQDQLLTFCGGPATRGEPGHRRMGMIGEGLLGAPHSLSAFYSFSDYELPRQIWETLLGRSQMGEYAYISRKPNEARDEWPRPAGTEYTMLINPDSRMKRYSWVTPDYVMGTRMDHPDALYCHIWASGEGVIFPTTPDATVHWTVYPALSVQSKSAMLLRINPTFRGRNPTWYPAATHRSDMLKVTFGKGIDELVERDGWVFIQEGRAFLATKIIMPEVEGREELKRGPQSPALPKAYAYDKKDHVGLYRVESNPYTLTKDKKGNRIIEAKLEAAALVVEGSSLDHHKSFEAFQSDILDNPVTLKETIKRFIVTYRGCGNDAEEITLNCSSLAMPTIDGKPIDYQCPAFDSPWLKGAFGSGVVTITGPLSGSKLTLDFNQIRRNEEQP